MEIMQQWMDKQQKYAITREGIKRNFFDVLITNKIPLSTEAFFHWLMYDALPGTQMSVKIRLHGFIFNCVIAINDNKDYLLLFILCPNEQIKIQNTHKEEAVRIPINENTIKIIKGFNVTLFVGTHLSTVNYWTIFYCVCNPELEKEYTTKKIPHIENVFLERQQILYKKLLKIHRLLNIETIPYSICPIIHLPQNIENNGIITKIPITFCYNNLSQKDRNNLCCNLEEKEINIKEFLYEYVDFGKYVINILKVEFTSVELKQKTSATVEINIEIELINSDAYYETIGYYRERWKNSCVTFNMNNEDSLNKLAQDLKININDYPNDNMVYSIIKREVMNLTWKNVENNL